MIVVLKDLNFEGQYINLGKKRAGHISLCWEPDKSAQRQTDVPWLWIAWEKKSKWVSLTEQCGSLCCVQTANAPGCCGRWRSTPTSSGGWTCWTTACFWLSSRYKAMNATRVSPSLLSLWEPKCELPQVCWSGFKWDLNIARNIAIVNLFIGANTKLTVRFIPYSHTVQWCILNSNSIRTDSTRV